MATVRPRNIGVHVLGDRDLDASRSPSAVTLQDNTRTRLGMGKAVAATNASTFQWRREWCSRECVSTKVRNAAVSVASLGVDLQMGGLSCSPTPWENTLRRLGLNSFLVMDNSILVMENSVTLTEELVAAERRDTRVGHSTVNCSQSTNSCSYKNITMHIPTAAGRL